jgi:rSAM/selenodomain-associated transferase 1
LFARPPEKGTVKTRLSPALPAREALVLYRGMLADAIAAAARADAQRRVLFWADKSPEGGISPGWEERVQEGEDLGARLSHAFEALLPGPVVAIGADCPELDSAIIDRGFEALDRADVVLGPASDGGYYMVGMKEPHPIFENITWGTDQVLEQTEHRAARLGLEVTRLDTLDDVDRPEDLLRLITRLMQRPGIAPHTRAALQELKLLP